MQETTSITGARIRRIKTTDEGVYVSDYANDATIDDLQNILGGGSSGTIDIVDVNASRNLLPTDVGKLLVTNGAITLTFDEAEAIPGVGSVISVLAGNSSTVAFAIAGDVAMEGQSVVLQAGQQAELIFVGASPSSNAVLVRRSVDGTAINPSSIGSETPGTAVVTSLDSSGIIKTTAGSLRVLSSGKLKFIATFNAANFSSDYQFAWGSTDDQFTATNDLFIARDAANTLAQRNGTNAQESRLYGTYTSSTNYERLSSKYDSGSGAFVIGTEKGASGGSARPLEIRVDGTKIFTFDANGVVVGNNIGHCSNNGGLFDVGFGAMNAGYPGIRFTSSAFLFSDHILCLGGNSASYPAIKRSGTTLQVRLADDSADAPITVSTVKTVPVLFAALPAAGTIGDGAHAFITDSKLSYNSLNIGSAVAGGGANSTPVVTIGGAWVVG